MCLVLVFVHVVQVLVLVLVLGVQSLSPSLAIAKVKYDLPRFSLNKMFQQAVESVFCYFTVIIIVTSN